jgi:indolepyruvate ferredoxin oxidoreductase alpha subunit
MTAIELKDAAPTAAVASGRAAAAMPAAGTRLFFSGNEAIARGAWESGVRFAAGYPGTPSTEILENLVHYPGIDSHWATNEKVAFEEGMGFAIAGGRSLVTMKHVGLNVASDAFMVFPYAGTNGGFVVISADDPGMHSSQNEQDNRNLARMARVPVIEPATPQECLDFLHLAYELSEAFGTPVMFRTTTRTAHCKGTVLVGERNVPESVSFDPDPRRFSVPIYRQALRPGVEERFDRLCDYAETAPFNHVELASRRPRGGEAAVGVVANGISRHYAREVFLDADIFDLGMTWPLPHDALLDFCRRHETVYILEEGDAFVEDQLRAFGATNVVGKRLFGRVGEYSPDRLAQALYDAGLQELSALPEPESPAVEPAATPRPPMFCVGCGHRTVFDVLGQLKLLVAGDIGCYTMGALYPYEAEHTTFCMGASIGTAVGFQRAGLTKAVAVIGDSTFLHSGIPALLDAVYTQTPVTVLILDNRTTGMTGQQSNPGSGTDLAGDPAPQVNLEALVRGLGVGHVAAVDAWDRRGIRRAIVAARSRGEPAVVLVQGPCQLLPDMRRRDIEPLTVHADLCTECNACYRIHCPAITAGPVGLPEIDPTLCVTCSVCQELCVPGAIQSLTPNISANGEVAG